MMLLQAATDTVNIVCCAMTNTCPLALGVRITGGKYGVHAPVYVQVSPEVEHIGFAMVPVYPAPQNSVPEVPAVLMVAVPPLVKM